MKKNIYFLAFIALGLLMLGGCRTAPVLNIDAQPISGKHTMQQVEKAIVRAGRTLGWRMHPKESGRMEGVLYLRTHMAKVDIMYDTSKYSIKYKDSSNLEYDDKTGTIHSNYNGWIENLNKAIQVQLDTM